MAGRPQGPAGQGEGADPAAGRPQRRAARATDGRGRQGLRVRRSRGPGAAHRPLRGAPAAHHLPLHVRPGVGRRLSELHRRHGRAQPRLPRPPPHARHQLRPRVPGPAGEARALAQAAGLGPPALVLVVRLDFNYDFRVSIDESVRPVEYNFRTKAEFEAMGEEGFGSEPMELPGRSCFLHLDGRVFHTYSQYARGLESTGGSYYFLDLTALGRQEDWEEPKGRSRVGPRRPPGLRHLTPRRLVLACGSFRFGEIPHAKTQWGRCQRPSKSGSRFSRAASAVLLEVLGAARHLHGPGLVGEVPVDVGGEAAVHEELGEAEGDRRPGGQPGQQLLAGRVELGRRHRVGAPAPSRAASAPAHLRRRAAASAGPGHAGEPGDEPGGAAVGREPERRERRPQPGVVGHDREVRRRARGRDRGRSPSPGRCTRSASGSEASPGSAG